jgi:Putative binding domain, N-terminal
MEAPKAGESDAAAARARSKHPFSSWALALLAALSALQLGSQSTNLTITVSAIPAWGQDGQLTGSVHGTENSQASLYIFEFVPDLGWFAVPGCGPVVVPNTGLFSINTAPNLINRYATRFNLYLLPSSLVIPCVQGAPTIPFVIEHNALTYITFPRSPQYRTISFGGLEWYVKAAPVQVYPGPQFFIEENAFVDAIGQLHLKLTRCSSSWCAAEVYTKQRVGYGAYKFTINSPVNNLDPNVTLGLFSWDGQAGEQYNREWDIEFGRWGNTSATSNAQYVVQPYNGPNNLARFLMPASTPSTHTVIWSPNQVSFLSVAGAASNGSVISQWNYPAGSLPVPTPGDVHLHLNLYVAVGQAPVSPIGQEIVISGFQYVPSGPQIGFSRASDNVPFVSSSFGVQIVGTGSGCSAQIESDSPWITVGGPKPVTSGGTIQYTVLDNPGSARTGTLILQSTSCNPALGAQLLTITQSGLVCDPTFARSTAHVGFLQSVRSVLVRGTSSACTWTVTSSAPWLQIVSTPSGAGDGSIQYSVDANNEANLRQAPLS